MMYGAIVLQIEGNFDDALKMVIEICKETPITLVNSVNPYRIEGQKTGAFEIIDALGDAPDYHFIPVGNAGNITAYWKGYKEYFDLKKSTKKPKMMGFQAEGSAPIVRGYPVEKPETIATAIRIGNPASWTGAVTAQAESNGIIDLVTDEEITEAQIKLARLDGVFCEPASAASIAGVKKMLKTTEFTSDQVIVSVLTGNGLKDPDRAIAVSDSPIKVDGNKQAVLDILKQYLK
jgi:threonine synthase